MKLLITNDDGVDSPGIAALETALSEIADVWVVAPEREQSAQSHAFTLHKPLRVTELGPRRFSISGTPADCAYAGVHGLGIPRPDFVVSGINRGANLGGDVHYSGTVAAAREAVLQGVPSLAISLYIRSGDSERHWDTASAVARSLVEKRGDLPPGTFLNVNVPNVASDALAGIRPTRLGRRRYTAEVEEREDPRGRRYVWIGGKPIGDEPVPDSDVTWARRGWATVTPLHTDPTSVELLEVIREWL